MNFMDAMIVEVESDGQTKEIALRGGRGYLVKCFFRIEWHYC